MSVILVVDDVPDIRHFCRLVLERAGHVVNEAGTAEEALSALDLGPLDGMVLDIGLPDREGWDVLQKVRARADLAQLTVVVCSAHAGPSERQRAEDEGATAFLGKPFQPQHLVELFAV